MSKSATNYLEGPSERTSDRSVTQSSLAQKSTLLHSLVVVGTLLYLGFFASKLGEYWFNPSYTTDDAFQQSFVFHEVKQPGLFARDLIAEHMAAYLPPLHYSISYLSTWLLGSPILGGHGVMFLQLITATCFITLFIFRAAGVIPACLGTVWFLHTESVLNRMTGGLPRGWWAPILAATVYFVFQRNDRAVLLVLLVACLLNPPAALAAGVCYGLFTVYAAWTEGARRGLLHLALLSPFFALLLYLTTTRSPTLGHMISHEQAIAMEEFSRKGGRFKFLPFPAPVAELEKHTNQIFVREKGWPNQPTRQWIFIGTIVTITCLLITSTRRRELIIPRELLFLFASVIGLYFAARFFAFRLYVPERYLLFGLPIFLIPALLVGLSRIGGRQLNYFVLLFLVCVGTRLEFPRPGHFTVQISEGNSVWKWFATGTPKDSIVAGHPTLLNPIQLLGERRGFVTTEAAHPFFDVYYTEIRRRLLVTFEAYYARDTAKFVQLLTSEGIDYFVFGKKHFSPKELAAANYFRPYGELVKTLAAGTPNDYVYTKITQGNDQNVKSYITYENGELVVIDINAFESACTASGLCTK